MFLSFAHFCVILSLCQGEADVKLEWYNGESGVLYPGFSHLY